MPPFCSDSWGELVHMHIGVTPPPLRSHNPDLPEPLEQVVARALAKDPAARFASMAELRLARVGGAPRTPYWPTRWSGCPRSPSPSPTGGTDHPRRRGLRSTRGRADPALSPVDAAGGDRRSGRRGGGERAADRDRGRAREEPPDPTPAAVEVARRGRLAAGASARRASTDPSAWSPHRPARASSARDGAALALTPAELSWPSGEVESPQLELAGHRARRWWCRSIVAAR